MGFEVNGLNYRIKHAVQAQNVFRHIVRNAESIGMVINASKTTIMCISGAEYEADAYILDADHERICCTSSIKALGVRFSNKLDMEQHIKHIIKSVRLWGAAAYQLGNTSSRTITEVKQR